MFEGARLAPLPLAPGKAPCCAMPATCWPHGRHGAAGLLSRAGAALTNVARRQTGVLEDAARRRQHVSARLTLTRASEMCYLHAIAAPARSVCSPIAARKVPTHRASSRLPSCLQSTQDDAERRRATHPSCRSSSTIIIESGQTRRRWPRGTGSAGHTRCPRGVQERRRRRRRGGCGSSRGLGEVASRRWLARWGALGACASGRATRRPSEGARGSR